MKTMILFVLAALALATPSVATEDDKSRMVGVWRYAGEVDTRGDGSPAPTSALSHTEGLLIYTADGFMSVNIMPTGRHWSTDSATIGELRETVGNGTAYSGRYEVDTSTHTVTHITAVSVEPDFAGKRLVRSYALKSDKLMLSGTFPYRGEIIHFSITWIRVRDSAGAVPPNQTTMQPTAGRCTAPLYFKKTRPLQATRALASGG